MLLGSVLQIQHNLDSGLQLEMHLILDQEVLAFLVTLPVMHSSTEAAVSIVPTLQ